MKVTKITRKVGVSNVALANTEYTVTTVIPHYLAVGDKIRFVDPYTTEQVEITCAAGTTGSTIVFDYMTDVAPRAMRISFHSYIEVENYGTGFVGDSDVFTFSFGSEINGLIHTVSNGTATATVKLMGSLDSAHWVDIGTAVALTAGSYVELPVNKPYAYGKVVFTVASADADGGSNTVKIFKGGC